MSCAGLWAVFDGGGIRIPPRPVTPPKRGTLPRFSTSETILEVGITVALNIVQDPSPNFSPTRDGHKPIAVVCHIEAGTEAGTDAWFAARSSHVSAHYSIAKTGEIHQHVAEEHSAWANGYVDNADRRVIWLAEAIDKSVNPNFLTISIEHEGFPGGQVPAEQMAASIALIREICDRWSIPMDAQHIIRHSQIDSVDRANCPGPTFPLEQIIAALQPTPVRPAEAGTKPVTPQATQLDAPKGYGLAAEIHAGNWGGDLAFEMSMSGPGGTFSFPTVLDSGAGVALEDEEAETRLKLPHGQALQVAGISGTPDQAFDTEMQIQLGDRWYTVPVTADPAYTGPNLLGETILRALKAWWTVFEVTNVIRIYLPQALIDAAPTSPSVPAAAAAPAAEVAPVAPDNRIVVSLGNLTCRIDFGTKSATWD